MKNFKFLIILFFPYWVSGQATNSMSESMAAARIMTSRGGGDLPIFNLAETKVVGSRFFKDEYTEGEIWLTGNRHNTNEVVYKFDEIENHVQVKYKDGREVVLFNNEIIACKMVYGTENVVYFKASVPNEPDVHRLFQLMYYGKKYQLIKLPLKSEHRKDVNTNSSSSYDLRTSENVIELRSNNRYFLKIGDGDFKEIKFKKSAFAKNIPLKKNKIEKLLDTPQYKGDLSDKMMAQLLENLEE